MSRLSGTTMLAVAMAAWATGVAAQTTTPVALSRSEARERNLGAYTELMRSDLRNMRVSVLTEMMQFSDAEDTVFWPVYREYEFLMSRLNDDRLALIETYSDNYQSLSPATATDLIERALDLEARRTKLKQEYFSKLKGVLSPVVAAKVMQIEQQIQLIIDVQVSASLPVLE